MSKTYDQGREEIAKLCKYFADNRQQFLAAGVKEAHIRMSLIDPFFEALGWDLRNTAMIAPQYREVITEDSLEIEGQQKAPDYTFRVGTLAKFYTEAKKCGVNINADPGPAYQLRRYGWSAKVPLSILTDFEELGVYDCSQRPRPVDKASFSRIQYFRSEEYPDRWRELWDIFSREAVWGGSFDRFAISKRKRGTSEVDSEFLKEIEGWRDSLARNIALRNQFLAPDDLNTVVQRTIDRIIFLRMAEDRGSEPYGELLKLSEQPNIYSRFMSKSCKKADDKYNSGLFHFQKEEGIAESADLLTPRLQVDDKVFKPILQSLYFEHGSPYHFGVLPVEILGTVYERFLGKVIRLTPEHRAKVEEKPEVRKAGGVYYTPAYIVDYIVKNTVGKMIEGKSPTQLAGGKNGQPLRVLDMACGSGSFLLGAFKCLLDHYQKWYEEHQPGKFKDEIYKNPKGEWRIAIAEKKRILTTHIFGVDIDPQAVEVSKLSLLLKVMEGETDETVGQSRMLFHQRALPNLSLNIKCGNSLIGPDYFSGRLIPDPDEMKRVNPFDWNLEFPEAIKLGGFDCIIGNPPYIDIIGIPKDQRNYFSEHYDTFSYRSDILSVFIDLGIKLLCQNGRIGFITSNVYFSSSSAAILRKQIIENLSLERLIDIGGNVFQNANVDTAILIGLKSAIAIDHKIKVASYGKASMFMKSLVDENGLYEIYQQDFNKHTNCTFEISSNSRSQGLVEKIRKAKLKLGDIFEFSRGYTAYDAQRGQSKEMIQKRVYHSNFKKNSNFKKELLGSDIGKYNLNIQSPFWIEFGDNLAAPRDSRFHVGPRVWIQRIRNPKLPQRLVCFFTEHNEDLAASGGLTIGRLLNDSIDSSAVCGLLNSKLINWFYRQLYNDVNIKPRDLVEIPLPTKWKSYQDILSELVYKIQGFHLQFGTEISDRNKIIVKHQIDEIDNRIDGIIFKLYGLTEEEIKIVEG
jgi:type I restriction-modification system DNA methylase subunit